MLEKRIVVFSSTDRLGSMPDKLLEFQLWLNNIIEDIPEEHRAEATINVSGEDDYGSCIGTLEIEYYRPLTTEELEAKAQRQQEVLAAKEQEERALLEQLKAKYNG